jgi:signal transduction histidine kinase
VALLANVCDTSLVLLATSRFTTGWYGARLMAVTAALVVLMSMLLAVSRLHRQVTSYAGQLRAQNQALEEAQGLRDHMVAVVSHDLRTPLTGLAGYQDLLATGALGDLPPDAEKVARRSAVLAQRLTLMVEDLLAVAGRGSSVLSVTTRDLDLAVELAAAAAVFPDLDLRISCGPGLRVRADALRLQQVLANLLTNARKYGAEPISLAGSGIGGDVVVEVSDAGPGVPAAFVPQLFEPWTRAEGTDTHGTGLGLSVVRELVERQGGTVGYEPDGNRFVVRLPAGAADQPPATGAQPSAVASSATTWT